MLRTLQWISTECAFNTVLTKAVQNKSYYFLHLTNLYRSIKAITSVFTHAKMYTTHKTHFSCEQYIFALWHVQYLHVCCLQPSCNMLMFSTYCINTKTSTHTCYLPSYWPSLHWQILSKEASEFDGKYTTY